MPKAMGAGQRVYQMVSDMMGLSSDPWCNPIRILRESQAYRERHADGHVGRSSTPRLSFISATVVTAWLVAGNVWALGECTAWRDNHPEWIFCDDFESTAPLVAPGRYFEYENNDGAFRVEAGAGFGGSTGMRVKWQKGQVGAGALHLAFGDNPDPYMAKSQIAPRRKFREIYYRHYLRMEPGWRGNPFKLSRVTVFVSPTVWIQAMVAHLWQGGEQSLGLDPATCIGPDGQPQCTTYNDFAELRWLGARAGRTPLFSEVMAGRWLCIEHQVRLNDPGKSNGLQRLWIDGVMDAEATGLDFVASYEKYGLNALFIENYWNGGAPGPRRRDFDNIVVSSARIGCLPP